MRARNAVIVVLGIAVILLLGIFSTPYGMLLLAAAYATPAVPLTRDLPSLVDGKTPAFNQRIQSMFPAGSAESVLVEALTKNGFERQPSGVATSVERHAHRTEHGVPCGSDFDVRWRLDAEGRVAAAWGSVFLTCL